MLNGEKIEHVRRELDETGAVVLPVSESFLSIAEFERLGELWQQLPMEYVELGDAGEPNHLNVGRFITDVERPQKVNLPISDEAEKIVMSPAAVDAYKRILDIDEVYVRRMQVNVMDAGSFIGYHLDIDSNPDYLVAVILQYGGDYEGGEYVVHLDQGESRAYKPEYASVTISNCQFPHEVAKITSGKRISLVYFLSAHGNDNRRERAE